MNRNQADNQNRLAELIRDGLAEMPQASFSENTMERIRRERQATPAGYAPAMGWKGMVLSVLVLIGFGGLALIFPSLPDGNSLRGAAEISSWLNEMFRFIRGTAGSPFTGILLPVLVTSAVLFFAEHLIAGMGRKTQKATGL